MAQQLVRTCWRGMQVSHPAEWELAMAGGVHEPGRCVFADRRFHRLDIRWRALKYVPNLDKMLEKYRRREEGESKSVPLTGAPEGWRGVARKTPGGTIVHAGRFFEKARWLVEAAVIWPERRDAALENAVLASMDPEDPEAKVRLWQAMGLSVRAPRRWELHASSAKVGRVRWDFRAAERHGPRLRIDRIALVEYWLRGALRDWLAEQAPEPHEALRRRARRFNGHEAEELISQARVGILPSLRGLREYRLGLAWRCPIESRVYHVSLTEVGRDEDLSLPEDVEIRCCRAPQTAPGGS